jgi:Tfp pilus assembly protein PilV
MKHKSYELRGKGLDHRKRCNSNLISYLLPLNPCSRGMTLVEVLIALAVFISIMIAVVAFEANVFSYQGSISNSFQSSQTAQVILKTILTEIREISPAANGSYPLVNAGSTTISFFSDTDNTGSIEQVTYSLVGTTLYRATIQPTGSPAVYNVASQSTSTLMVNVRNGTTTPLFQYYDTNYSGTSTPLTQPVTTTNVRLVKVNITLDIDPNRSPHPVTYSVQAGLRNVKTNL